MTVEIRRATVTDAQVIAAIHAASWKTTYRGLLPEAFLDTITADSREPMWNRILGNPDHPGTVWVAMRDGEVVGFCAVMSSRTGSDDRPTLEVQTIYLKPGTERHGIGSAMFHEMLRHATETGYRRLELWVHRDNANARAFYEAHGWITDDVPKVEQFWGQERVEVRYRRDVKQP